MVSQSAGRKGPTFIERKGGGKKKIARSWEEGGKVFVESRPFPAKGKKGGFAVIGVGRTHHLQHGGQGRETRQALPYWRAGEREKGNVGILQGRSLFEKKKAL